MHNVCYIQLAAGLYLATFVGLGIARKCSSIRELFAPMKNLPSSRCADRLETVLVG